MERVTLAECEDSVEKWTKVPETDEETMEAQMQMISGIIPNVEGLRQMRWGLDNLRKVLYDCPGTPHCQDHVCIGKPQHQAQMTETFRGIVERLEKEVETLQSETAFWLYKYMNCDCDGCRTQEKVNAAPFN